ncbi:MAG: hypothetical protein UHH87_08720, partial [Akkermansia sp.]|nr:hypothetical protein [Akkermansia sp.]
MMHYEFNSDDIWVESTSRNTANATPIELEKTEHIRFRFVPKLIDNPNNPDLCVSGDVVFEKKKKRDEEYPTERVEISKRDVTVGDSLRLHLDSESTYKLYIGLKDLYELKQEIGTTELGVSRYRKVDSALAFITRKLKDDPYAISLLSTDG